MVWGYSETNSFLNYENIWFNMIYTLYNAVADKNQNLKASTDLDIYVR